MCKAFVDNLARDTNEPRKRKLKVSIKVAVVQVQAADIFHINAHINWYIIRNSKTCR